jgi:outer membrane immunogenic protein
LAYTNPYNWSGAYIGVNGGYAWGKADEFNNSATTDGALLGFPAGGPILHFPGPDRSVDSSGGFGGVTIGANWQTGNVVLGLEADFQGADISGDDSFSTGAVPVFYDSKTKINWFGTVRGRVGYAFDRFMPYFTGGFAYMHSKADLTVSYPTTGSVRTASTSGTNTGWVIGGGIEAAIAGNWTVKAEYLYVDFGTIGSNFDFGVNNTIHADADVQVSLVRAGLNYRF